MLTSQVNGKPVFKTKKTRKGETQYKKVGKVHLTVFSPDGKTVYGYLVQQPDLAMMIKRPDLFVAFDCLTPYDKGFVIEGEAATDEEARKRLGADWDRCLLWNGMNARTTDGKVLGFVSNVSYKEETGRVVSFHIDDGHVAKGLVGAIKIPVKLLVGYKDGNLMVKPEAANIKPSGGLAGTAGEAYARAKKSATETGAKVSAKAGEAVQVGSYQLGKTIGKAKRAASETSKEVSKAAGAKAKEVAGSTTSQDIAKAAGRHMGKVGGMFKAFKDEFDEASK